MKEGINIWQTAKEHGVHPHTVYSRMWNKGLTLREALVFERHRIIRPGLRVGLLTMLEVGVHDVVAKCDCGKVVNRKRQSMVNAVNLRFRSACRKNCKGVPPDEL